MAKSQSYLLEDPDLLIRESKRLYVQARAMFEREFDELKKHVANPKTILELGCGNAAILSIVGEKFPEARLAGFDRNANLLEQAEALIPQCEFVQGDLGDSKLLAETISRLKPDLILFRYVFQHLSKPEIHSILAAVKQAKSPNCVIAVIDVDDRLCSFEPAGDALRLLLAGKGSLQRKNGGDRTVGAKVPSLLLENGFEVLGMDKTVFSSKTMGWSEWESVFCPVILSGAAALEPKEADAVLKKAKAWIEQARADRAFFGEFHIAVVTGK